MKHFYRDVPGLGNVVVSRHAQARLEAEGISQEVFDRVLLYATKPDIQEGIDIVWREHNGVRLVILVHPTPDCGAALIKTAFRIEQQASIIRR